MLQDILKAKPKQKVAIKKVSKFSSSCNSDRNFLNIFEPLTAPKSEQSKIRLLFLSVYLKKKAHLRHLPADKCHKSCTLMK